GARGGTFNNGSLWLAVDGSTSPYLDAAETPAGGSFADVEPPRVSVVASTPSGMGAILYAGAGSQFYLSAVDDAYAVGDGLGTGPVQTFLSIDGSSFTLQTSSFTLPEGSHALQFYGLDAASNASAVVSTNVAVAFNFV
ncbi:MAG: hypothetical protein HKL90_11085, partial [Elusimicrobia bacterium]|nr:hypothetical protein [Elusimicrobiota bacterium]